MFVLLVNVRGEQIQVQVLVPLSSIKRGLRIPRDRTEYMEPCAHLAIHNPVLLIQPIFYAVPDFVGTSSRVLGADGDRSSVLEPLDAMTRSRQLNVAALAGQRFARGAVPLGAPDGSIDSSILDLTNGIAVCSMSDVRNNCANEADAHSAKGCSGDSEWHS